MPPHHDQPEMNEERPYTIAADGKSITCHTCGRTSHNQNDVTNVYCAHCKCYYETGLNPGLNFADRLFNILQPFLDKTTTLTLIVTQPRPNPDGTQGTVVNISSSLAPERHRQLLTDILNDLNQPPQ